ncbi:HPr kinase/phosphorylase [Marinibaculum pumilum]|uniref:HPr kinase/phosphorylase n=1 Tax=Marinibaculum pumilum TaxID=1766165 RepID=A0ABV7L0C2_9PROT
MSGQASAILHATCIAIGEAGVLLRGPSGSGKSDLALRLIDAGAALVADDMVALAATDGRLRAAPPPPLAGLLEVRGIGPLRLPHRDADLCLAVDLVPAAEIERVPLPAELALLGCRLPLLRIDPEAASAPARLRLAVACRDQLPGAHLTRAAAE